METDERLRWLELHITTSLKPRVDDLKQLFSAEENRFDFRNLLPRIIYFLILFGH